MWKRNWKCSRFHKKNHHHPLCISSAQRGWDICMCFNRKMENDFFVFTPTFSYPNQHSTSPNLKPPLKKKGFQQIAEIFLPDDAFLCILSLLAYVLLPWMLLLLFFASFLCTSKTNPKIVVTLNIEKWTNLHLLILSIYMCSYLAVNY